MRNAKLYRGTEYVGSAKWCGGICSREYVDDNGFYTVVFEPSHIDYAGNVICFYTETVR